MADAPRAGDLEQVDVAGEVRPDIAQRVDERMADARLRAEVDDAVEGVVRECGVERVGVAEVEVEEGELAAQSRQPVALELRRRNKR